MARVTFGQLGNELSNSTFSLGLGYCSYHSVVNLFERIGEWGLAVKNVTRFWKSETNVTSPLQSHLGRERRHHSRQRMHSAAPCATSCQTQTSHSPAGTLCIHASVPHASDTLHFAVRSPLPKKKFAHSLTGDINPQNSHWNNEKNENCLWFCLRPDRNFKLYLFPASRCTSWLFFASNFWLYINSQQNINTAFWDPFVFFQ